MFTAHLEQKQDYEQEAKKIEAEMDAYRCPITEEILLEPVSTTDCGHTFEKAAIEQWRDEHHDCPACRKPIGPPDKNVLIPASHLVIDSLEVALEKYPKYKDERYFNLALFTSILMKGDSSRLRNMISALSESSKLLNTCSDEEKFQGLTPLYYLVKNPTGLHSLATNSVLCNNISSIALNSIINTGPDRDKSILFLLSANEKGRQILLKNIGLQRKITRRELNRIFQTGPDKGRSVLYMLASTETGRQILLNNMNLIGNISRETFSAVIVDGVDRGRSVEYWLKSSASGRQILDRLNDLHKQGKFIINQNNLELNPTHFQQSENISNESLGIVSSLGDVFAAQAACREAKIPPVETSLTTISSIEIMQSNPFIDEFKTKANVNSIDVLEGLTNMLAQYKTPLGLLNKILALTESHLNFVISDDDSMNEWYEIGKNITHWMIVEKRLHQMIDFLSYISFHSIVINFLNRNDVFILTHQGETPAEFRQKAHGEIRKLFEKKPAGPVPLMTKLKTMNASDKTFHYFFINKAPTDSTEKELKEILPKMLTTRSSPEDNPVTFIQTVNKPQNDWLKFSAPYTAVVAEYEASKSRARETHGASFPYTEGFWLVCQLVAAKNPDDLIFWGGPPLNKFRLDNIMGRKLSEEEYRYYFTSHPLGKHKKYLDDYDKYAKALPTRLVPQDVTNVPKLSLHN